MIKCIVKLLITINHIWNTTEEKKTWKVFLFGGRPNRYSRYTGLQNGQHMYMSLDVSARIFHKKVSKGFNSKKIDFFIDFSNKSERERNELLIERNIFKACVRYFLSDFYFSSNDNPLKTMKNAFSFI